MTEEKLENVEGWCVKCNINRKMDDAEKVVTKNNRNAVKGKCSVCGTNMFKFTK
jgi:hypothetical protein